MKNEMLRCVRIALNSAPEIEIRSVMERERDRVP